MTDQIEKVLIHPLDEPGYFGEVSSVWNDWRAQPTTLVLEWGNYKSLRDRSILDKTDPETGMPLVGEKLRVGGMATTDCVRSFLMNMSSHPRVLDGEVQIIVDKEATFPRPEEIQETLDQIYIQLGVVVMLL